MAKECTLSSGKPPLGCLSRESVIKITDRLDMTSAVYRGRKASTQTNQTNIYLDNEYNVQGVQKKNDNTFNRYLFFILQPQPVYF